MILGVVSLAGTVFCLLPVLVAPLAWVKGARAVREIDASGGRLTGRTDARAGVVTGMIGTAALVLLVLAVIVLAVVITIDLFGPSAPVGGGNA